jgi:hypothetical protein
MNFNWSSDDDEDDNEKKKITDDFVTEINVNHFLHISVLPAEILAGTSAGT